MKGEKKLKIRIRRILFPILFCLAVACIIELPLAQTTIFGDDVILWDTLFRSVIAVPMLVHLYREDSVFRGKEHWNGKIAAAAFFSGAGMSLAFGLAVRALQISGAALADESLFTGNLWLEAVVLLAASPILEEYFFRGVLYGRCKELVSAPAAAFIFRCVPLGPCAGNLQLLYGADPGISYGKNEHGEGTGGVPFRGESGGTCSGGFLA